MVAGSVTVVVGEAAPAAHPANKTHMTIAFRRPAMVFQLVTGDLPLCVMKRLVCIAVGMALLAAGCNVDEGSTTPQTLAPLGAPSETIP